VQMLRDDRRSRYREVVETGSEGTDLERTLRYFGLMLAVIAVGATTGRGLRFARPALAYNKNNPRWEFIDPVGRLPERPVRFVKRMRRASFVDSGSPSCADRPG